MKQDEFNSIIESQVNLCLDMLVKKGEEYATEDRMHNFKASAGISGTNLRGAVGGMMVKHTTSVYDMIGAPQDFDMDVWEEKITDHINYLLLLKAALHEERNTTSADQPIAGL